MPEENPPSPPLVIQILSILRRPIEYGLTGAALVGVLFLANRTEILPKVFKGAGFEVEFQERVIQTTADTEQGIKVLRENVKDLKTELEALRSALETSDRPLVLEPRSKSNVSSTLIANADSASGDSLLVERNQLIQSNGFMWIGTFDPESRTWTDNSVQTLDGTPLSAPSELSDEVLTLTTTVNVRNGYPKNDDAYYRAVRAIGIAETGTRVTLQAVPQPYFREGVQQVWAEVDAAVRPYIGTATAD